MGATRFISGRIAQSPVDVTGVHAKVEFENTNPIDSKCSLYPHNYEYAKT